jgi:hypothetical protein
MNECMTELPMCIVLADEWKSDPDFALYLSQLSSLSMEKLREYQY